jgi:type I site-specific restriction endonuclease
MFTVEFPSFDFNVKTENGKRYIFDIIRKKFILNTPEEWVRQHIVHYLISEKNYQKNYISVEHAIELNGLRKRCDIVVFNRQFQPAFIIECKKPEIDLTQHIFDQAGRYNLKLKVPFVAITNGTQNMVATVDFSNSSFKLLQSYPRFEDLQQ